MQQHFSNEEHLHIQCLYINLREKGERTIEPFYLQLTFMPSLGRIKQFGESHFYWHNIVSMNYKTIKHFKTRSMEMLCSV